MVIGAIALTALHWGSLARILRLFFLDFLWVVEELKTFAQVLEEVLIHVRVNRLRKMRGSRGRCHADRRLKVCHKNLIVLKQNTLKRNLRHVKVQEWIDLFQLK